MKHICLDCNQIFDAPKPHMVPDHTGFDGVQIDVCPVCISDHIQLATGLFLPALDAEDIKGIERMCQIYTQKCVENKVHTNDPTLLLHYTALIDQATNLLQKIKNSQIK